MRILDSIHSHDDLVAVKRSDEAALCQEIREFLVENVSKTGGHLSANLGVVELSVAIEKVFDTRRDRLVFDVGHQAYVHKILTGRKEEFSSLRQFGGIAGFPKPSESEADAFVAGHASSAVSTALGMARARTLLQEDYSVIALLGDGALTGGLAYEALNDAGESHEPLIVILNDNGMSITPNVGGIAQHLSLIRTRDSYFRLKKWFRSFCNSMPGGKTLYKISHRFKEYMKRSLIGTRLFEEMGFEYMGPVDGHDITRLIYLLKRAKEMERPVLLHVLTQKGRGYPPAEQNPDVFHGIGRFDPATGATPKSEKVSFSATFGKTLSTLALEEPRVCAITAAMQKGTGLDDFAAHFPNRFFDVGIAEGHAVSMAGGLAKQGMIPVVAIYSTFLQRAFDMILQDVSMLNLHVVFAVDRAGLVGEDGETHHGVFDVGFLRQVPNMTIYCPSNQKELHDFLRRAILQTEGPVAIRYPRGGDGAAAIQSPHGVLRPGKDVTLVSYGRLICSALDAAELLHERGLEAEVIKLASIKPIDFDLVVRSVQATGTLLVIEECVQVGSVGEALSEELERRGVNARTVLCNLGDRFVTHGSTEALFGMLGLDAAGIAKKAEEVLHCEN